MLYFRLMSDKLRQVCHLLLSSRQGLMNRAFDVTCSPMATGGGGSPPNEPDMRFDEDFGQGESRMRPKYTASVCPVR